MGFFEQFGRRMIKEAYKADKVIAREKYSLEKEFQNLRHQADEGFSRFYHMYEHGYSTEELRLQLGNFSSIVKRMHDYVEIVGIDIPNSYTDKQIEIGFIVKDLEDSINIKQSEGLSDSRNENIYIYDCGAISYYVEKLLYGQFDEVTCASYIFEEYNLNDFSNNSQNEFSFFTTINTKELEIMEQWLFDALEYKHSTVLCNIKNYFEAKTNWEVSDFERIQLRKPLLLIMSEK